LLGSRLWGWWGGADHIILFVVHLVIVVIVIIVVIVVLSDWVSTLGRAAANQNRTHHVSRGITREDIKTTQSLPCCFACHLALSLRELSLLQA
jgi:hypothetical protein